MPRLKILILSVGSLLGQNLLDALEGRRHCVTVIGADAGATSPRLFRCDTVYRAPRLDDAAAFRDRLREIIAREQPQLVLAGRDHDVIAMGELRDAEPALTGILPCGSGKLAAMIQDKWESYRFSQQFGLPMAETILTGPGTSDAQWRDFAARHSFPLIAKPRRGYGTQGTRVLFEESQLRRTALRTDFVVQPYLAPAADLRDRFFDPADGWPLFHALVDDGQFSAQSIIAPSGETAEPIFCGVNTMVAGRSEFTQPVADAEFSRTMRRFAHAAATVGWRGPFNVQFRRLPDGTYWAFEFSGRMTGTTSARRLFGFDEIGLVGKLFAGVDLPLEISGPATAGPGWVTKSLADFYTPASWAESLAKDGVWRAAK